MASGKEIRTKIKSIQNTQKITKAMEMVAASKMRRAQDRMEASRPYATKMRVAIGHLVGANPPGNNAYLTPRENIKRVGLIVVATDRGLCGGLNVNLFRKVAGFVKEQQAAGVEVSYSVFGRKAVSFFKNAGGKVVAVTENLGDAPKLADMIGGISVMLEAYEAGELDAIYIANNDFVNTMSQSPEVNQLVPVQPVDSSEMPEHWDYLYEPDPEELLETLLRLYVESQVYQASVENVACEMAARMVAMKSASDNAGDLIDDLQLAYNKARQASITTELTEIVAGAAAV